MTTTEEQKKAILPFLQRADEVAKVEPKVAYYCRMYAVEQGLALPNRSPQIDGVLGALLAKLEKDKATVNCGPGDQQYCENFAVGVFNRADRVDRAGRADKNTSMTYYASSIFMEVWVQILRQFGELSPDLADMQRYAAWKAADIRKALREGRTPTAGPPDNTAEQQAEADLLDQLGLPPTPGMSVDSNKDAASAHDFASLPSAPSSVDIAPVPPPIATHLPPPSSSGPSTDAHAAPRFKPGSKVIYSSAKEASAGGVKGTVARLATEGTGGPMYLVALSQSIVQATEDQLAPEYEPGQRVIFHNSDGSVVDASVGEMDITRWRPKYTITCDDGTELEVSDVDLDRLKEPRSPLMPPASPPPSVAAPSPTLPPNSSSASLASSTAQPPTPPARGPEPPAAPFASSRPPPSPGSLPYQNLPTPPPPSIASGNKPTIPSALPGFQPDLAAVTEAHKMAKYAASSLGFEDVPSAVKYLTEALKLLTQPQ